MQIPKLPPIVRQVVARAQETLASTEERTRRLTACRGCPHLRTPLERCGLCGCPIVSKTTLLRAHCPDNPPRW